MVAQWRTASQRRVFCFDVETRPGPYGGQDFTFKNMLSIAGRYEDDPDSMMYACIEGTTAKFIKTLVDFTAVMKQALIVTHNGPRYDLPLFNGTLIKYGLGTLGSVLVSDTYAHLPKRGQAFSASLGNMADRFGVDVKKGHMGEVMWERAYAGDPEALEQLRLYNTGDVETTLALRKKLLSMGLLGPPRVWRG